MPDWVIGLGLFAVIAAGLVIAMVLGFALAAVSLVYGIGASVRFVDVVIVGGIERVLPYWNRAAGIVLPYVRVVYRSMALIAGFILRLARRTDGYIARFPRTHRVFRWTLRTAAISATALSVPVLVLTWYLYLSSSDVPDPDVLLSWRPSQIGYVYDRNGLVTVRLATTYRETVASEFVPEIVRQALVSAEDKRFWEHNGWDPTATFRAGGKYVAGPLVDFRSQGGSTITQQVARNLYLEDWLLNQRKPALLVDTVPTRVLSWFWGTTRTNIAMRKVREVKYAIRLEKSLARHFERTRPKSHGFRQWLAYDVLGLYDGRGRAKESVLGTYANLVYLGNGVYGVSYGARFYFGKDLETLTADEAAFLASLIPLPGRYANLEGNGKLHAEQIERRNTVLDRMALNGYLDPARLQWLKARPLLLTPPRLKTKTEEPAVVSAMLAEIGTIGFKQQDVTEGRVRVHLSADRNIQAVVNAAVLDGLFGDGSPMMPGYAGRYGMRPDATPQVAVVVLRNRDAAILSLFGGLYDDRLNNYVLFNRATQARRQPGSTFKSIDALALVAAGLTPDSMVYDGPTGYNMGGWFKPVLNYDRKYQGWIPLREAIAQSRNAPILRSVLDQGGGYEPVIRWARALGITSQLNPYPSTILGASGVTPLEMTNAFRAIVSGRIAKPFLVDAVTDHSGNTLYHATDTSWQLAIPHDKLAYVHELLRGTVRLPRGTAHGLDTSNFPIQVMAKTGTSDEQRDAWFIASTFGDDGITVGVWVGYDDFALALAERATGASVALPISRSILLALYGPSGLLGKPPQMPTAIENRIDAYRLRAYPETNGANK